MALPHPDGDPNRCIWHVASYMYLPPEMADAFKVDLTAPDLTAWFREHDVRWALQRPDFHLYGTARDAAGATELVAHLRSHL